VRETAQSAKDCNSTGLQGATPGAEASEKYPKDRGTDRQVIFFRLGGGFDSKQPQTTRATVRRESAKGSE